MECLLLLNYQFLSILTRSLSIKMRQYESKTELRIEEKKVESYRS